MNLKYAIVVAIFLALLSASAAAAIAGPHTSVVYDGEKVLVTVGNNDDFSSITGNVTLFLPGNDTKIFPFSLKPREKIERPFVPNGTGAAIADFRYLGDDGEHLLTHTTEIVSVPRQKSPGFEAIALLSLLVLAVLLRRRDSR